MSARHRRSIRLPAFDYGAPGAYFVTICSSNRAPLFGRVVDGLVQMTDLGRIAQDCWEALPAHFPWVELDAFAVMPNHVHGILVFQDPGRGGQLTAPTDTPTEVQTRFSTISPRRGTLGLVIRTYKAAVTTAVRRTGHTGPMWQRNYYEHIIRGEPQLRRLRDYIATNPARWASDAENPDRPHSNPPPSRRSPA